MTGVLILVALLAALTALNRATLRWSVNSTDAANDQP